MTREEIITRVNRFLVQDFEIAPEAIHEPSRITEDLGLESLDMVDLSLRIEQEFGFKPEATELMETQTIGELYDTILAHVG